eukprot:3694327-Prymnesium_polylepis.1
MLDQRAPPRNGGSCGDGLDTCAALSDTSEHSELLAAGAHDAWPRGSNALVSAATLWPQCCPTRVLLYLSATLGLLLVSGAAGISMAHRPGGRQHVGPHEKARGASRSSRASTGRAAPVEAVSRADTPTAAGKADDRSSGRAESHHYNDASHAVAVDEAGAHALASRRRDVATPRHRAPPPRERGPAPLRVRRRAKRPRGQAVGLVGVRVARGSQCARARRDCSGGGRGRSLSRRRVASARARSPARLPTVGPHAVPARAVDPSVKSKPYPGGSWRYFAEWSGLDDEAREESYYYGQESYGGYGTYPGGGPDSYDGRSCAARPAAAMREQRRAPRGTLAALPSGAVALPLACRAAASL